MSEQLRNDVDPGETREWLDALESLLREEGPERARFLSSRLFAAFPQPFLRQRPPPPPPRCRRRTPGRMFWPPTET